MFIGLLSGAIAAILAALLSLPLHSPDDVFFNTASVTIGALLAGVVAGALRRALPQRTFLIAWTVAFAAVLAGLVIADTTVERMLSFGAPIAALTFAVTGAGVVMLPTMGIPRPPMVAGAAAIVAAALGLGLAGQGDAESGALALPPAPTTTVAASNPSGSTTTTTPATGTATGGSTGAAAATAPRGTDGLPTRYATQADLKGVTFVVGEGSQATFTVTEKLAQLSLPNEAVMKDTALTGDIRLDGRESKITIDLLKLSSDQANRDRFVRNTVFSKIPTAVLTVPALTGLPARYEAGQVVKQTVNGTLAINGIEKPIAFDVEARMDGTTLNVLGKTAFLWKDFNMTAPATPTVSVQDRVAVEVLLVSKPKLG